MPKKKKPKQITQQDLSRRRIWSTSATFGNESQIHVWEGDECLATFDQTGGQRHN